MALQWKPHSAARTGLFLALVMLIADQALKLAIVNSLQLWQKVEVIPGFFNLVHVLNQGAAFGFLSDSALGWQNQLFAAITALAVLVILYLILSAREGDFWFCFGLGAILGGALGNLTDRLRLGGAIDFLDFHVAGLHWPAFNLADACITLGAIVVLATVIRGK